MSTSSESGSLYGKAIGAGLMGLAGLAAEGLVVADAGAVTVQGWDLKSAKKVYESPPLAPEYKFGVTVATGDLDGDGKAEIMAGSIVDSLSYIKLIGNELALDKQHKLGGIFAKDFFISAGDLDGDGIDNLVLGSSDDNGSQMAASDGTYFKMTLKGLNSRAFDHKMSNGMDGVPGHWKFGSVAELVVAPSASIADATGHKATSTIRRATVDIASLNESPDNHLADYIKFRPEVAVYGEGYTGGIRVAAGDVTGDGIDELLTLNESGASRSISFLKLDTVESTETWVKYRPDLEIAKGVPDTASFTIACGDLDGDGHAEVVVAAGAGGGPHVRVFSYIDPPVIGTTDGVSGWVLQNTFTPYGLDYTGGFNLAVGDFTGDGFDDLVFAPASFVPEPATLATVIGAAGFFARRRRRIADLN